MNNERPGSRKAELVDRIAHDIRKGYFRPRERLIEAELCRRYAESRGAVRMALVELDALGLIEREAHRGARVRSVSATEAIESTEVRLTLQGLTAARAAQRANTTDKERLRKLMGGLREAVANGDR